MSGFLVSSGKYVDAISALPMLPAPRRAASVYADPTAASAMQAAPVPGFLAFMAVSGPAPFPRPVASAPSLSAFATKTNPDNLEVSTYPLWRAMDTIPLVPTPKKPESSAPFPGVPIPVNTTMLPYFQPPQLPVVLPVPRNGSMFGVGPVAPVSVDAVFMPPLEVQPVMPGALLVRVRDSSFNFRWFSGLNVEWLPTAFGSQPRQPVSPPPQPGFLFPTQDPQLTIVAELTVSVQPLPPGATVGRSVGGEIDAGQVVDIRPWAALLNSSPPLRTLAVPGRTPSLDTSHALFQTTIASQALGFPAAWTQQQFPLQSPVSPRGASSSVLTLDQSQEWSGSMWLPFVQSPGPFRLAPTMNATLLNGSGQCAPWLEMFIIVVPGPYVVTEVWVFAGGAAAGEIETG